MVLLDPVGCGPAGRDEVDDEVLALLVGFDRDGFVELVATTEARWRCRRQRALAHRPRKRGVGGGRPFALPFAGRLFLTVLHERWSVPYRGLAAMFGLGRPMVERAGRDLAPLLGGIRHDGVVPPAQRGSRVLALELERRRLEPRTVLAAVIEMTESGGSR